MRRSLFSLVFLFSVIVSAEPEVSSSFQGYSGLINTPSADLFDSGNFYFQYSNQTERLGEYSDTANFHFGIGLWDFLEISARNSAYGESLNEGSDLSANVKLAIPFVPEDWFSLAIGVQDLGGATDNFDSKYIVASKEIVKNVNISMGIGQSDSSFGRLDGVFGGISWQVNNWAKISLEYDSADTNVGLHFSSPKHWFSNGIQLTANVLAYSSNEQLSEEAFYGVGITMPLDSPSPRYTRQKKRVTERPVSSSTRFNTPTSHGAQPPIVAEKEDAIVRSSTDSSGSLDRVKQILANEGFESIKTGKVNQNTAYIELENHIYNRNQLDGIGVALGLISTKIGSEYEKFRLVLKEREVAILVISGSLADYRAFLRKEKSLNINISTDTYHSMQNVEMTSRDSTNGFWLKPRFTFWPSLVSAVGTEYGMFDASAALVSHVELPLWKGAAISAAHMTQLAETEDFKDGRVFGDSKQQTGLQEYSLHQTFALPFNLKNMTFVGRYRKTYNYLANEIRWQNNDGSHKLGLLAARYENQDVAPRKPIPGCNILFAACWPPEEASERDVVVGMYRYYSTRFNASAELQVGQYWQQDKGVVFKLTRMFGDVSINLSYKNTKLDNDTANKFIGLGFSIPLTPRKGHSNKYFQVRGAPQWSYTVNTLIDTDRNELTPGTGDSARMFYNLDSFYFNLDRLGSAYIYNNANRLRRVFTQVH